MAFEFLPNIPAAPHENTRYIQGHDAVSPICPLPENANFWERDAHGKHQVFVEDKRVTANDITSGAGSIALRDVVLTDWNELEEVSKEWLRDHLAHMPALDSMRRRKSSIKLAIEGLVTVNAFLEVGPKVLARRGVELGTSINEVNDGAATYARRSQGFITKWGRIGVDVDRKLAQALAVYSRKAHRSHDVFADLHFDPKHFWADTEGKRIGVDPVVTLRSWAGTKLSQMAFKQPEELFGCPALHMLPAMYQEMARVAHSNGLFGATYLAEVATMDIQTD